MPDLISYKQATKTLTPAEKVGQSFMPAAYINDTEEAICGLEEMIRSNAIGGICFFHSRASAATNFEGPKEVIYNEKSLEVLQRLIKRYQAAATYPLLISIDAEWGLAMRVEETRQYPYAITLGAMTDAEDLIRQVGQNIGMDCRNTGIHWNFAPVADVNNNPENPVIGYRSFGENPEHVARCATAFARGLQNAGVLNSAKHFPGHGDTATDSHLGLPLIDKSKTELHANELIPFLKLINKSVDSVMIGHLTVPSINGGSDEAASVSYDVISQFLRNELSFKGAVVSDALNMHAVSKTFLNKGDLERTAYAAGTDVLCYAENIQEGIRSILEHCSAEEIEEHFKRVWQLKEKAYNNTALKPQIEQIDHSELLKILAERSLSNYKGSDQLCTEFREQGCSCFTIPAASPGSFLPTVASKTDQACNLFELDNIAEIESRIVDEDKLLIALYPPSIKPANNFGLSDEQLEWIERLAKEKKLLLYLFGNPYVLNILNTELFDGIWIAYQDFPEFQHNAAMHFLGKITANGKLPVSIANN